MSKQQYKSRYNCGYKHLQLRGRRWFYRRVIPTELRERFGRREIVRALGTESLTEAEHRAEELDCRITGVIEAVRMNEQLDAEALVARLCDTYLKQLVAGDRDDRRKGLYGPRSDFETVTTVLASIAEGLERDLDARRFDAVEDDAQALLVADDSMLEGDDLSGLLYQLLHTRVRAKVQTIKEMEGDLEFEPEEPLTPILLSPAPGSSTLGSKTLGEAVELYVKDRRESGNWTSERAAGDRRRELNILVEILGAGSAVSKVSPEDILKARAEISVTRANTTVSKIIGNWTALFNWVQRMGWISRNPARHLRPKRKKSEGQRQAFDDNDLAALFGPRLHGESLGRDRDERWWVMLLALFTGARVEELAQLEVFDIKTTGEVDYISITDKALAPDGKTEKRTLKTETSERLVPLHSALIELGFLEYVSAVHNRGHRRLFHQLRKGRDRGFGVHISSWFGGYRKRVGVTSAGKAFHSFRHTTATRLRAAGVEEATVAELLGHRHPNITFARYGKTSDLSELKRAIDRLDFSKSLSNLVRETERQS